MVGQPLIYFLLGCALIHMAYAACDTTIDITNQCEDAGNEYSDLLTNMDLVQTALTTVTDLNIAQLRNKFIAVKNAINAELDRLYTSASACCDGNKDDSTCSCHGNELTSYFYSPQNDLLHYQPERCGCYHGPCGCKNGERQGYPAPVGSIDTKCLPPPSCIPLNWFAYPGWALPDSLEKTVIGSGMTADQCFQLCTSQADCYGATYQGDSKTCLKVTEEAVCGLPMIPSACCYTILKKLCSSSSSPDTNENSSNVFCTPVCRPEVYAPPPGYDVHLNCPDGFNSRTVVAIYLSPHNLLEGDLDKCHYSGNNPGPLVCGRQTNTNPSEVCPTLSSSCSFSELFQAPAPDIAGWMWYEGNPDSFEADGCPNEDITAYNCAEIQYICEQVPVELGPDRCLHVCNPDVIEIPSRYSVHLDCPDGYTDREVHSVYITSHNLWAGSYGQCHYNGTNPWPEVCGGLFSSQEAYDHAHSWYPTVCPAPSTHCNLSAAYPGGTTALVNDMWDHNIPIQINPADCPEPNTDPPYICLEYHYRCLQP